VPADLSEVQRLFHRLIAARGDVASALEALGMSPQTLGEIIAGDARAGAVERLDIYANAWLFRLHDALAEIFPRLRKLMGSEPFAALVRDYLQACPPSSPRLEDVGRRLPAFMASRHADAPWLAGLAALEEARDRVFELADAPGLELAALQSLPPEQFAELPLPLIPAHALVRVDHAIDVLWQAIGPGDDAGDPLALDAAAGPRALLVWRPDIEVWHRAMSEREAALVDALSSGTLTFGHVCDRVVADVGEDDAPAEAFRLLAQWVQDGLIRRA
jgi:hypothetical protein